MALTAIPSNHRYGADAIWSHSTDQVTHYNYDDNLPDKPRTLISSFHNAELSGYKYNFNLLAFDTRFEGFAEYLEEAKRQDAYTSGKVNFGIYFPLDRWADLSVPVGETNPYVKFPEIPDYYETAWTQNGVDAGFNVTVGQVKQARYPAHGQDLYNISNGSYGYDEVNSVAGQYDVLTPLADWMKEWYKAIYGMYPSAMAYRYSQDGMKYATLQHFLGIRRGGVDKSVRYDFTRDEMKRIPNTTQIGDSLYYWSMDRPAAIAECENVLQTAIDSDGWYRDFCHWQTSPNSELYEFFASQRAKINENIKEVLSIPLDEAFEHIYLRDMATVTAVENVGTVVLQITYTNPYTDLPTEDFKIPLSVEVDLSGSILDGKDISSTCKIRKLSANKFIVEAPVDFVNPVSITLSETATPDYMDFTLPQITQSTVSNGIMNITTDKPTRLAIFIVDKGGQLYNNRLLCRDNTLNTEHTIDLNDTSNLNYNSGYFGSISLNDIVSTKDIYVGVITEERQSILSDVIVTDGSITIGHIRLKTSDGVANIPVYELNQISENNARICIDGKIKCFNLVDPDTNGQRLYINGKIKSIEKE